LVWVVCWIMMEVGGLGRAKTNKPCEPQQRPGNERGSTRCGNITTPTINITTQHSRRPTLHCLKQEREASVQCRRHCLVPAPPAVPYILHHACSASGSHPNLPPRLSCRPTAAVPRLSKCLSGSAGHEPTSERLTHYRYQPKAN
jgi:hypothetical protein